MANKAKDLASGTLSSSISASSTSISVSCGSGSDLALLTVWPTTPFYITVMPANPSAGVPNSLDSEIMKVSALNANDGIVNMAVSRGQRGTTAKAFSAGDIVSHAVYAEDAVLLGEEVSPENPSPWIGTDEIEDGAITTAKIANSAVTNAKIDWSSFTTTYTTCSYAGAVAQPNSGSAKVVKIGKVVNLMLTVYYNSGWNLARYGDELIATIPEGYRPQDNVYGAAMVKFSSTTMSNDNSNGVHLWVGTNGQLRLNNMCEGAITGVASVRGNLTWVVA